MTVLSIAAQDASAHWVTGADGTRLRLYRLNGPADDGPVLLWGHANGFSAGSYLPWLQRVAEQFTVYAFDARGHGGSERPPEPLAESCRVDCLARDLAAIVNAVRAAVGPDRDLHFASHSFTGLAALRLGVLHGQTPWRSATFFEPPLSPTADVPGHAIAAELAEALVRGAEKRRPVWDSPDAFADRLAGSSAYAYWDQAMLRQHAHAILQPRTDGEGYELCCDPAVEAAGYRMTMDSSTFRYLGRFDCPTTFVASDLPREGGTPSWASRMQGLAADRVPGARLVRLPGTGHMMIFEAPDDCLRELFTSIELANGEHAGR